MPPQRPPVPLVELFDAEQGMTMRQRLGSIPCRALVGSTPALTATAGRMLRGRGFVILTTGCPSDLVVVHQDGTIGQGYLRAPKSIPVDPEADVDDLAAEHRLLCYRSTPWTCLPMVAWRRNDVPG